MSSTGGEKLTDALRPTFPLHLSGETLDEREDEEDDERGHANASEGLCSTCNTSTRHLEVTP